MKTLFMIRPKNLKPSTRILSILAILASFIVVFYPSKAKACCSCLAQAYIPTYIVSWTADVHLASWLKMEMKLGSLADDGPYLRSTGVPLLEGPVFHKSWVKEVLWEGKNWGDVAFAPTFDVPITQFGIKPALEEMTKQLRSVALQQTMAFGTFLDAKHQMETQTLLQKLSARAHKDYQTSLGVCEFGSHVQSLAASEEKNRANNEILGNFSHAKNLSNANLPTTEDSAFEATLFQYRTKFCDPNDLNGNARELCQHDYSDIAITTGEDIGGDNLERMNKDIDFIRTFDTPWTLNIDFTDDKLTYNEEEILALKSNLFSHDSFKTIKPLSIANNSSSKMTGLQGIYMDMRAIQAKESVAENSFNAITAMKSTGAPGSREFVVAIMENLLGGADPDIEASLLYAEDPDDPSVSEFEPSYYAQMEILTKKLLQDPQFYTDLYDKPANVNRKKVSLQAVGLMQKFDLFKSHLRNEATLSLLLEMELTEMQGRIENQLNQRTSGTTGSSAPGTAAP